MSLVIDASIALAWCFEDEATVETDMLMEVVRTDGALVPTIWHLELANVLMQAEKRNRLSAADVVARLELMAVLPITTDQETGRRAWRETLSIARAEKLTSYDAAYLELALRKALPLASLDRALIAAARRLGVKTAP